MQKEDFIPAEECCSHYQVEFEFIRSLQQSGLLEITILEEKRYISADQLRELEKFIRLRTDLELNPEGIEVVHHLLDRIRDLQDEIAGLKNRLSLYDSPGSF